MAAQSSQCMTWLVAFLAIWLFIYIDPIECKQDDADRTNKPDDADLTNINDEDRTKPDDGATKSTNAEAKNGTNAGATNGGTSTGATNGGTDDGATNGTDAGATNGTNAEATNGTDDGATNSTNDGAEDTSSTGAEAIPNTDAGGQTETNAEENKTTKDDEIPHCHPNSGSVWLQGPGNPYVISSPGYPKSYNAKTSNLECKWKVRPQFGSSVKMHVVEANMKSACKENELKVFNDKAISTSKLKSPGLKSTCGQSNFPGPLEDIKSKDEVEIEFFSHNNVWSDKFKLVFLSTPPVCPAETSDHSGCKDGPCCSPEEEDCSNHSCVITVGTQPIEIKSPKYPEDSGKDKTCEYTIKAVDGSRVSLNFLDMDILQNDGNSCFDYVEVVDKFSDETSLIGKDGKKFCGLHVPNYPGPSLYVSRKNHLSVKYITDGTTQHRGKGFKATVSAVNPWCRPDMTYSHLYGDTTCEATCTPEKIIETPICECPQFKKGNTKLLITVKEENTGEAISNAEITVSTVVTKTTPTHIIKEIVTTDSDGKSWVDIESNGDYKVTVTAMKYLDEDIAEKVDCDICSCTNKCEPSVNIILQRREEKFCKPAPLTFEVKNERTGHPMSGVSIKIEATHTTNETQYYKLEDHISSLKTDIHGKGETNLVFNGNYTITLTKDKYDTMVITRDVECTMDNCTSCKLHLPIKLTRPFCEDKNLTIWVKNEDGAILPTATVNVTYMSSPPTILGESLVATGGFTSVTIPDNGSFKVNVERSGPIKTKTGSTSLKYTHYVSYETKKEIHCNLDNCDSCSASLDVILKKIPREPICNGSKLNINVIDKVTQIPIPNANVDISVEIDGEKYSIANQGTAGDHNIEFMGNYTIVVDQDRYQTYTKNVDIGCTGDKCPECSEELKIQMDQFPWRETYLVVTVYDAFTKLKIDEPEVKIHLKGNNVTKPVDTISTQSGSTQTPIKYIGDYGIHVKKNGYVDSNQTLPIELYQSPADVSRLLNVSMKTMNRNGISGQAFTIELDVYLKHPQCEPPVNLNVSAIDNKSKNKIAGAKIEVVLVESSGGNSINKALGESSTDENGLSNPEIKILGIYEISARKDKYDTSVTEHNITSCNTEIVTLHLNPIKEIICNFTMIPTVANWLTKIPIPAAMISIQHSQMYQQKVYFKRITEHFLPTNDKGLLEVDLDQNGVYELTVKKTGYIENKHKEVVKCLAGKCDECQPQPLILLEQPHCPNKTLTVNIKECFQQQPIEGVTVTVSLTKSLSGPTLLDPPFEEFGNTDKTGVTSITIPEFIDGDYSLKLQAEGYKRKDITKSLTCDVKKCDLCSLSIDPCMEKVFCPNLTMTIYVHNALNNEPLKDATVTASVAGHKKPIKLPSQTVGDDGTVNILVRGNGYYTIHVTKPGFITLTKTVKVDITLDKCDTNLVEVFPLPPVSTCNTGIIVSLSWKKEPQDLDLFSFATNTTTMGGCLTYYCDVKDQCGCTQFNKDSKNGGLQGSETISYCCQQGTTHMIYVDDRSGHGASLEKAGADIIISSQIRGRSNRYQLKTTKNLKTPRYWLAGCLTIEKDGYNFEFLNEFSKVQPNIGDSQQCQRRGNLQRLAKTVEQETVLTIKVIDTDSKLISKASIEITNNIASYAGTTDQNGVANIRVFKNGNYKVAVNLKDYTSNQDNVEIECKETKKCKQSLVIALVKRSLVTDDIKVILIDDKHKNNEDDDDNRSDVSMEDNKLTLSDFKVSVRNPKVNCRSKEHGCDGVNATAELITLKNVKNHGYTNMIIVGCLAKNCKDLEKTKPRIVVVSRSKSQTISMPKMGTHAVAGAKFWIAGCLKLVTPSFVFVPTDIFLKEDPSNLNNQESELCHGIFKEKANTNEDHDFCEAATIDIKIVNSNTGNTIKDASATVHHIQGTTKILVSENAQIKEDKVLVKIESNGIYLIDVEAPNFTPNFEYITVACNIENCESCKPTILISMAPKFPAKLRIMMNWNEQPEDLNINVFQVDKQPSMETSCLTDSKNSNCPTVQITQSNNHGGHNGGEEVTFDSTFNEGNNFVYMVYVNDVSEDPQVFVKSHIRLSITDSTVTSKVVQTTDNFNNDKVWFAGCLRAKGDSFQFSAVNMFMKNPPNEVIPFFCNDMFGLTIDPNNCLESDTTYVGSNLNDGKGKIRLTAMACRESCMHTDQCVGFVWEKETQKCWLKAEMKLKTSQSNMISGLAVCKKVKAIDGGWSDYSECSTTCGGGTKSRTCTNPTPDFKGLECQGDNSMACNTTPCPIDGGWSDYSECSTTCGGGTKSRTCTHPTPVNGHECEGDSSTACNTTPCPIDGGWSDYSECSTTCGGGIKSRTCTNPAPVNGHECEGDSSTACNTTPCQVREEFDRDGFRCLDKCDYYGKDYTWCHTKQGSVHDWGDCSQDPMKTKENKSCKEACSKNGETYYWCYEKEGSGWNYCSPPAKIHLITKACTRDAPCGLNGNCEGDSWKCNTDLYCGTDWTCQPKDERKTGCNNKNRCPLKAGDCDSDANCLGDLICGDNDCSWNTWSSSDDCCQKPPK